MRCYNGCPDEELQILLDEIKKLENHLPLNTRCVYFPGELHPYQIWTANNPVGPMFDEKADCLRYYLRNNQ